MTNLTPAILVAARILLALIFVIAGFDKIGGYQGTQAYMASQGVPGALLPLVIALELGGGLAIIAGLLTRWVALALAGFSIMAGVLFHFAPQDQMQMIMLMKNFAIAGGFLALAAQGAGAWSIDARLAR